jgi:hypothetical protein
MRCGVTALGTPKKFFAFQQERRTLGISSSTMTVTNLQWRSERLVISTSSVFYPGRRGRKIDSVKRPKMRLIGFRRFWQIEFASASSIPRVELSLVQAGIPRRPTVGVGLLRRIGRGNIFGAASKLLAARLPDNPALQRTVRQAHGRLAVAERSFVIPARLGARRAVEC